MRVLHKTQLKVQNLKLNLRSATVLFFIFLYVQEAQKIHFTSYASQLHTAHPYTQPDTPPLPTSSCCILCGEAGTRRWKLSCTDVFDSSVDVSWVLYMCGEDHLLPYSVYWIVKPGGHRPTWAHSEAPHSHRKEAILWRIILITWPEPKTLPFPQHCRSGFCYIILHITVLAARVPHKH